MLNKFLCELFSWLKFYGNVWIKNKSNANAHRKTLTMSESPQSLLKFFCICFVGEAISKLFFPYVNQPQHVNGPRKNLP